MTINQIELNHIMTRMEQIRRTLGTDDHKGDPVKEAIVAIADSVRILAKQAGQPVTFTH